MKKLTKIEKSRAILREALLHLLLEKDFTKITIQDICKKANVVRSTFYNHYVDKTDLMEDAVAFYSQIAKDTVYTAFLEEDHMDLRANLLRDYRTTVQYSEVVQALFKVHLPNADFEANLREILREKYKALLANKQFNAEIPEELGIGLYTSNALLVTKHLASHGNGANLEELADFMFSVYQTLFIQIETGFLGGIPNFESALNMALDSETGSET